MSNFHSFAGGAVWMAVAAILMLATFEPVSVEPKPGAAALQITAEAPVAGTNVAV
jgi:hypothetical protein